MSLNLNTTSQLISQEVVIPQGDNNNIEQIINQEILINVIEIPKFENFDSISNFLPIDSDIFNNNQFAYNLNQNQDIFASFLDNYLPFNNDNLEDNNQNLVSDNLDNNDEFFTSFQSTNQDVFIEGNNNLVNIYSEQIIYNLSLAEEYNFSGNNLFNQNNIFNPNQNSDNLIEDFADNYLINATQIAGQSVEILGENNDVSQILNQNLTTFIFLDKDSILDLQENSSSLYPTQLISKENIVDTNNNIITQTVNQNIEIDFSLSTQFYDNILISNGDELTNTSADIDEYINESIIPISDNENESLTTQKARQKSEIRGDNNTDFKNNNQVVTLTENQQPELIEGSENDDIFKVSLTENFEGIKDLIITKEGNDLVDLSNSFMPFNLSTSIPTDNTIYTGKGDDTVIAQKRDSVFGNEGNDSLQGEGGENYFYGGKGDDTIVATFNDTSFGNEGNDLLNVSDGNGSNQLYGNEGDDTINGGEGDDTIFGGKNKDSLFGNSSNDFLFGNLDDDIINGGKGDDTIHGGKGNDTISGSDGDDYLSGGKEKDLFILDNKGIDTITDFNVAENDVFALTKDAYNFNLNTHTGFSISNANDAINSATNIIVDSLVNIQQVNLGNSRFAFDTTNNHLLYDADGNWANDNQIQAMATVNGDLSAHNFVVV